MACFLSRHVIVLNISKRLVISQRCSIRKESMFDPRIIYGNREVVGYGLNSHSPYQDLPELPFPKVRWQEPTQDLVALRKKEMGDWKHLSIDEKKTLYRYSFRQTFAEMKAPTGEWKKIIGIGLMLISLGIWMQMGLILLVYRQVEYPITLDEEHQKAQLRRMLDLQVGIIDGLSSKWDYENDKWK